MIDAKFHEDSYGYRPNKSALEAIGIARKRRASEWLANTAKQQPTLFAHWELLGVTAFVCMDFKSCGIMKKIAWF